MTSNFWVNGIGGPAIFYTAVAICGYVLFYIY